ncbi:flagellar hook-associated protein FlgK [uncultured Nocardioides sp.]|uniref:flagellar hook-associated protein FlgK n=1 Tax=uncultured Nocardioides sp. TaxID=198441 RepID=UPI000C65438D|nr:flagellar hook-associated protein FlgK [Nocardioides sp.]MCK5927044.1 flagellar hook-associated protein FlgK [Nocardioides sp.]
MSGTLSSLNTALSALRYNRVAMDVASHNIANVATEGYNRRRVDGESMGAPVVPARWSTYEGAGSGVRTSSIVRMNDVLLDNRARTEHSSLSYLQLRATALARMESGVGEPGDSGVSAAMADFRSSWQDLANDPGGNAARGQVLARAESLAGALAAQAANVSAEMTTQRLTLQGSVAEVDTVATELAATNRAIATAALDGVDVSDLADTRDVLGLRLAELTGGVGLLQPDGTMTVSVAGVSLVSGSTAGTLRIATGVTASGGPDGSPVTFAIDHGATSTTLTADVRGEVGASADLLNTTLPAYAAGLGAVARDLADTVNAVHAAGYDLDGTTGTAFFSYDPADPAATLTVAVTARQVAASSLPGGVLDGSNADVIGTAGTPEGSYQRLVNGFGTEVASAQRLVRTQSLLTTQVDSAREQLSGVNLDEETVAMLTAQRAYEAAARVMSVMDSVLDTLINRTGIG